MEHDFEKFADVSRRKLIFSVPKRARSSMNCHGRVLSVCLSSMSYTQMIIIIVIEIEHRQNTCFEFYIILLTLSLTANIFELSASTILVVLRITPLQMSTMTCPFVLQNERTPSNKTYNKQIGVVNLI